MFRILGLPIELRLMVYEQLPRRRMGLTEVYQNGNREGPRFDLLSRCVDLAILRTSKTIHAEAKDVLRKVTNDWMLCQSTHFIVFRDRGIEMKDDYYSFGSEMRWVVNDHIQDLCNAYGEGPDRMTALGTKATLVFRIMIICRCLYSLIWPLPLPLAINFERGPNCDGDPRVAALVRRIAYKAYFSHDVVLLCSLRSVSYKHMFEQHADLSS